MMITTLKRVNEQKVERYLMREVQKRGGFTRKLAYIGTRGAPDRLVVLPPVSNRPRFGLVELKAPDGKLTPLQAAEMSLMHRHQMPTYLAVGYEGVDKTIAQIEQNEIQTTPLSDADA